MKAKNVMNRYCLFISTSNDEQVSYMPVTKSISFTKYGEEITIRQASKKEAKEAMKLVRKVAEYVDDTKDFGIFRFDGMRVIYVVSPFVKEKEGKNESAGIDV